MYKKKEEKINVLPLIAIVSFFTQNMLCKVLQILHLTGYLPNIR